MIFPYPGNTEKRNHLSFPLQKIRCLWGISTDDLTEMSLVLLTTYRFSGKWIDNYNRRRFEIIVSKVNSDRIYNYIRRQLRYRKKKENIWKRYLITYYSFFTIFFFHLLKAGYFRIKFKSCNLRIGYLK